MSTEAWGSLSTGAFSVAFFSYLLGMVAAFHHLAFRKKVVWSVAIAATATLLIARLIRILVAALVARLVVKGEQSDGVLLAEHQISQRSRELLGIVVFA